MLPVILLLILGFNGAVYLLLGELLVDHGYNGYTSATLHALGSGISLTCACLFAGRALIWRPINLSYYLVGATLGLIGPAVATFWAIPHVGTGLMSVVIATSPLFTVIFSHIFQVEKFSLPLLLGILLGFVGTLLIILAEVSWPTVEGRYLWLAASLIVPALLAMGNVARTALWPDDTTPPQAGSGISLVALAISVPLLAFGEPQALSELPSGAALKLMLAFVVLNGVSAFPFFYLQRLGGPTLLSLLSHVMAAFGLLLGAIWLGETYRWSDLFGAALILAGVSITSLLRARQKAQSEGTALV